jgi:bacterial/archaeal transporter family-2 protein
VSGGEATAAALSLGAGLAGSVQVAVMGRFGDRIGTVEALAFATLVQLVLTFCVLVAVRQSVHGYAAALHTPAWMWIGGLMGAFIVFTVTFATPRVGAAATIGLMIAGQLLMGAAIDRFGLFGLDRIPLHWPRLLGLALLAAGAALSLKK